MFGFEQTKVIIGKTGDKTYYDHWGSSRTDSKGEASSYDPQDWIEEKHYRFYGRQGWSRNFGPVVKVDRMTREVIQNEETKEPFSGVQGQGCA